MTNYYDIPIMEICSIIEFFAVQMPGSMVPGCLNSKVKVHYSAVYADQIPTVSNFAELGSRL